MSKKYLMFCILAFFNVSSIYAVDILSTSNAEANVSQAVIYYMGEKGFNFFDLGKTSDGKKQKFQVNFVIPKEDFSSVPLGFEMEDNNGNKYEGKNLEYFFHNCIHSDPDLLCGVTTIEFDNDIEYKKGLILFKPLGENLDNSVSVQLPALKIIKYSLDPQTGYWILGLKNVSMEEIKLSEVRVRGRYETVTISDLSLPRLMLSHMVHYLHIKPKDCAYSNEKFVDISIIYNDIYEDKKEVFLRIYNPCSLKEQNTCDLDFILSNIGYWKSTDQTKDSLP